MILFIYLSCDFDILKFVLELCIRFLNDESPLVLNIKLSKLPILSYCSTYDRRKLCIVSCCNCSRSIFYDRISTNVMEHSYFHKVRDLLNANYEQHGSLNLNVAGRNDLSSSWVREHALHMSRRNPEVRGVEDRKLEQASEINEGEEIGGRNVKSIIGSKGHHEEMEPAQRHQRKVGCETRNFKFSSLTGAESQLEESVSKDEAFSGFETGCSEEDFTTGKINEIRQYF